METEKLTFNELQRRKIEFFSKLKELIDAYVVDITYFDSTYSGKPEHYGITTDAHLLESWDNTVFLKELNEEEIDFCIDELKLDLNR